MAEIYGALQPLTGAETVTVQQLQSGQIVTCTMPLSALATLLGSSSTAWATGLPTAPPTTSGAVWNDNGVVSIVP
jgi:hypothetical protein